MIGKFLLPLRTRLALKLNNAIRVSESYLGCKKIGVLYTYESKKDLKLANALMDKLEREGKEVTVVAFIPELNKQEEYGFPHFGVNDMNVLGDWNKSEVVDFCKEPFDYLLHLDMNTNKVVENILARSKSKCRVGRFEEGKSEFYELMIDHKEAKSQVFIDQIHHYIKSVRNG